MQATSSKHQEHSPRKEPLAGGKSDSVAQLVMNINTQGFGAPAAADSHQQLAGANSVESDKEVEEITNRAAKVHLGGAAPATGNDQNNNNNNANANNATRLSESNECVSSQQPAESPFGSLHSGLAVAGGLISSEPVSGARQQLLTPTKLNLDREQHRRQRHSSSSKESDATRPTEVGAAASETITLDTKVPHPASSPHSEAANNTEALGAGLFSGAASCSTTASNSTEKAYYYNDLSTASDAAQAAARGPNLAGSAANSCSGSSSSGSGNTNPNNNINNNSAGGQQPIRAGGPNGIAITGPRSKPLPAKEQKLSIIVPGSTTAPAAKQAHGSVRAPANDHTATALDVCSRDYCNDFDDYDTRYDTAAMEDSPAADDEQCAHDGPGAELAGGAGQLESPSSPKAKSAPATPSAFHQHNSSNKTNLPNPANTLPVDTRRNISATCRMLPSSINLAHAQQSNTFTMSATIVSEATSASQLAAAVSDQYLDNLIDEGDALFSQENYGSAIRKYSRCVELATQSGHFDYLKRNFRVYSQRAESYFKLNKFNQAIEDSMAARELNPKWAQAHYILGKAQFHLDRHVDSLTAFSFGLAQVPNDQPLFEALVKAALNSSYPTRLDFEENYSKLRERDLDKDPFVVVATLGQELLSKQHHQHAAIVLESALKLANDSKQRFKVEDEKRFRSSVLSTTSFVFCAIGDYNKALAYMKRELEIETELNDVVGQCRVLGNIGYSYYKMRKFEKSLEAHRQQLTLAGKNNLRQRAAQAFNATGHVHMARNKPTDALNCHTWCLNMLKQLEGNEFDQYKELLAMGHVNAQLADYQASEEKYKEAIQMLESSSRLKTDEHQMGLIMVHFNLAYLGLKRQSFVDASQNYETVISIAKKMDSRDQRSLLFEIRALNGLGHTCRIFQRFNEAKNYFARQLELARKVNDRSSLSQALCNLGMVCQHFKDYKSALAYFEENMRLVEDDSLLKAYAHSYLASMHFLWGQYTQAYEEYEKSLNLFKELEHCSSERKTIELNMFAVSERLGRSEISLASESARTQRKIIMA